jgi:penicillin-insensitive murein endopeptidase
MSRTLAAYFLLVLVCSSVAAEPTHKQTKAAAAPSGSAGAKNEKTTPKEPIAKELAKEPPANELFGAATAPAPLAARAIGSYAKGCLAGAVALPINGPDWQVMRLSRNRNWGTPQLLDFLEKFASDARALDGWPGLLVGDMSQPRGGPMITGHSSHQIGLDVDIWLTPMPDRILTPEERENMMAVSMLKDPFTVDPDKWTPLHTKLIKRAASYPEVERIFVHPAIKKVLCDRAVNDRDWLAKVRPWWNHYYHFHVRVACPPEDSDCEPQKPPNGDDGCGQELSTWFAMLKKAAIAGTGQLATGVPRKSSITMSKLPQECGTVLTAGGFEPPIPVNADNLPQPVRKALASKETGPPPPKLDPAARRALIASSSGMPLPERNPRR